MEAFDTLAFAKRLKNAGYSDVQAEALAELQAEIFRGMLDSSLATKTDPKEELGGLGTELKEEIDGLGTDLHKMGSSLKAEIAGLRSALYRALLAQTVVLLAAMVAIIGAFKRFG